MDKKYILDKLSQIDKNKYSISELGLFGSYAKDNADNNSDIDILVKLEFKKGMYQNFCELQKELEKIFNRKVDLIEKETFDNKFRSDNVRKYKEKIKEEILGSVIYELCQNTRDSSTRRVLVMRPVLIYGYEWHIFCLQKI